LAQIGRQQLHVPQAPQKLKALKEHADLYPGLGKDNWAGEWAGVVIKYSAHEVSRNSKENDT